MLAKKIRNETPSFTVDQVPYWRSDMKQVQLDCFYESVTAGMLVLKNGVSEAEMLAVFDYQVSPCAGRSDSSLSRTRFLPTTDRHLQTKNDSTRGSVRWQRP